MGFITVGKGNSTRNQYVLLGTLNADQEALAASMQAAWANFAASGDPSSTALPWPSFDDSPHVMSLLPPQPQVETNSGTPIVLLQHFLRRSADAERSDQGAITKCIGGGSR